MYETCVRGEYVVIPNPLNLVCIYKLSRSIFWIQKIFCSMMCWLSYVGMLALTYDASAIYQDLNLFLPEADSKDPVVNVCHHCTPAIGYLANRTT
jgi:hypothetical protein